MDYQQLSNKTILVTGGAGAIGSNLTSRLAQLENQVIILDNLDSAEIWNIPSRSNILFVRGDIRDEIVLKRVFAYRPPIVFHLAAFFANQNSVDHPETDLMVNGLGTLRLLQYCQLAGVERFIYASSGCSIYGSNSPLPLREDFLSLHLSTPYQITKMLGELYCNFFFHHYGLPVVKTRFFNSYGPGELPGQYRNVIPNFIYWALKGHPLPITGTGDETRDFTYVDDLTEGLVRAAVEDNAIGQDFNFATGREVQIRYLASLINDITGNDAGVVFLERRHWDTKSRVLASIDKAREFLNYEPNVTLENGLSYTVQWFREHWGEIDTASRFGPGSSSALPGYDSSSPSSEARV